MTEKTSGYFTTSDGVKLYYETRGTGEPSFLFVYGIGCVINHWEYQLKFFSQTNRCVISDFRGHHQSQSPSKEQEMSLERVALDLSELVNSIGLKNVVLLGHSFGVPVCIDLYFMIRDKVKALVLVNGFAENPLKQMFGSNIPEILFDVVNKSQFYIPQTLRSIYTSVVSSRFAHHIAGALGGFNLELSQFKDIEIYAKGLSNMNLMDFTRLFQSMVQHDVSDKLRHITAPCLVIAGENDSITPRAYQLKMSKEIQTSEFLEIPGTSHCAQLDAPQAINDAITSFLHRFN